MPLYPLKGGQSILDYSPTFCQAGGKGICRYLSLQLDGERHCECFAQEHNSVLLKRDKKKGDSSIQVPAPKPRYTLHKIKKREQLLSLNSPKLESALSTDRTHANNVQAPYTKNASSQLMLKCSSSQTSKCQKAIDHFPRDVAQAKRGEGHGYDSHQLLCFTLTLCYSKNISLHMHQSQLFKGWTTLSTY